MYSSVHDFKTFYSTRAGRLVRRFLTLHIRKIWPDLHGLRLVGCGYAVPYLKRFMDETERSVAFMPDDLGVHFWPEGEKGLVCLSRDALLPLETESVDRIILVHGLEHAESPHELLHELWRVLKSNGRLLMIVPNRRGLWARTDQTPFGHGTPYTARQIGHYLQESLFVHERTEMALFMPPFRSFLVLRTAYTFESFGRYLFPGLAGVSIVEASKQIYAGAAKTKTARAMGKKRVLVTNSEGYH